MFDILLLSNVVHADHAVFTETHGHVSGCGFDPIFEFSGITSISSPSITFDSTGTPLNDDPFVDASYLGASVQTALIGAISATAAASPAKGGPTTAFTTPFFSAAIGSGCTGSVTGVLGRLTDLQPYNEVLLSGQWPPLIL